MNLLTLKTTVATVSTILVTTLMLSANAQTQSNYAAKKTTNRSSQLITETATISNQWHLSQSNSENLNLNIRDSGCKKANPLDYINQLETFFKSCETTITPNTENYEPIEYLKAPALDSGIRFTVTNFK